MAPVGRPPRINRQMIAEAAHELGLDQLTLKAVADHLGSPSAALYHYVKGKDDLLRPAAEYAASRVPLPEDHGQHWAIWLLTNGPPTTAMSSWPGRGCSRSTSTERSRPRASPPTSTSSSASSCGRGSRSPRRTPPTSSSRRALGTAVATIRERQSAKAGRNVAAAYRRLVRQRKVDDLPYLRALPRGGRRRRAPPLRGERRDHPHRRRHPPWRRLARDRRGSSTAAKAPKATWIQSVDAMSSANFSDGVM